MNPEATVAEVRRRLSARPERVFSAFADPELVSRWLTPSPQIRLAVLAFEFRVGGGYRFAYHVSDGQVMTVNGTYHAIEPPRRIVFSWNIEPPDEHAGLHSEVTIAITPAGNGSELHIRHAQLDLVGALERHARGWQGALDGLDALLTALGEVT